MATVLVTGFGPYGNTPTNPAEAVARTLDGTRVGETRLVARVVPCVFFEAIDATAAAIADVRPDLVVMLGEFGGRAMLTVERIAQNLNDASRYGLADNVGRAPVDERIAPDGPAAYYATLPIRAGWIHLPALPSVAALETNLGMPSMNVETGASGLRVAIEAALAHPEDIRGPERSTWQI